MQILARQIGIGLKAILLAVGILRTVRSIFSRLFEIERKVDGKLWR
jgi:hypothetical protein